MLRIPVPKFLPPGSGTAARFPMQHIVHHVPPDVVNAHRPVEKNMVKLLGIMATAQNDGSWKLTAQYEREDPSGRVRRVAALNLAPDDAFALDVLVTNITTALINAEQATTDLPASQAEEAVDG